jgi:hypothetical protein
LDAKTTLRVFPLNGFIDAGDHTGPAFQTACKFDYHLSLFTQRIEVCRTGINTEPFFAVLTDLLVEPNMGFLMVFKRI